MKDLLVLIIGAVALELCLGYLVGRILFRRSNIYPTQNPEV